ncbi:MAG: hypothetical protein IT436_08790 [Phycisphaerales bacterium]|nr:hypothetical protein [Phycisphaerales bacterium]
MSPRTGRSRSPSLRGLLAPLLLCCVAWLLAACASDPAQGYSFKPLHDENIRTVAVPVWDNETFSTGLEVELTEAIIKEIQRTTRWAVVPAAEADSVLSGSITGSELRRFSSDSKTGLVEEMGVELRVDFDWQDNRTGRSLVARRAFSALDTFVPAEGTGERIEKGQHGAVQQLARDIVAELRTTW